MPYTTRWNGRLQFIKSGTTLDPVSLQSLEYAYDPAGNVDWIKDWKTASPQLQDFTYDALSRLTNAVTTGGTVGTYSESYSYNTATGNLTSKGGVTLNYADANHAHAVSSAGINAYLYDANGNMTRRTPSGQSAYNFAYDAEGHLVEVKLGSTVIATFKYDGDGQRVQSVINGVTTLYYGLVEIDNHGAVQPLPPVFSDVPNGFWAKTQIEGLYNLGILSACATNPLRYCPSSSVTRIDAIRDILRARHGSGYMPPAPSHYFSDMVGHSLEAWADQAYREGITSGCSSSPRNVCPANTVTRAEIVIFLLKAKHGAGYVAPAASHYFADMNGHWAEAWADQAYREGITSGCSANPRNFCPTGLITHDMNAVFIENTFDRIQPPQGPFSYNGTWRKYYFAGPSRIAMRTCASNGGPACSAPTFFLSDHLGSTSLSVAMNGEKTSQLMYKPWGEIRYAWSATASLPTQYTFTGQLSHMDDPTTGTTEGFGLMFYNARWYDPYITQFSQPDSIVPNLYNPQSLNRYSYVHNNPLRYTDPSGHKCEPQPECNGPSPEQLDPNSLTDSGKVGYKVYRKFFRHVYGGWILDPRIDPRFMTNGTFTVKDFVAMVLFEESNSISRAPFFDKWTETNVRGFYEWKKGQDPQFTSGSAGLLNYMWGTSGRNTRTEVSFDGGPNASIEIPAMQGVANAMLNPASVNHAEWADGCVPGAPCYMGSYTHNDQDPAHNLPYIFKFINRGCSPSSGVYGDCNEKYGDFIFFLDRCQSAFWRGQDDPICP